MELYYHDRDRDILVLRADGDLNSESADQMVRQLEEMIASGLRRMIIDFSKLDYISSMGIGKLIGVNRRLKEVGGDIRLAGVGGMMAKVLELVHLNKIFAMFPDVEQARLSFGTTGKPGAAGPSGKAG
jgi:anti-sigma B factor antagonist